MKLAVDLHIHSCLSPCGEDEMTPNNIVGMAALKGLGAIAVTDHNGYQNAAAVASVGSDMGLVVVPGMEVTDREEVHLLCYFPDVAALTAFGEIIQSHLPGIPNRPDYFGSQIIMNEMDEPMGTLDPLLIPGISLSMEEVYSLAREHGGVMVPAHINRGSHSILANLGFMPAFPPFPAVEAVKEGLPLPDLTDKLVLRSSDAHNLGAILEQEFFLEVEQPSAKGILDVLAKGLKK
ncbi:PHP domain-containing protein [Gehongia tenuis]|uniref:PHP domain-containing protein n=1 Tax=Gehongia tenuis TaxID=2763655 RepID=A0A926D3B3_9FIRM|nr:PHP domain-containing protein [Gehongia tenuis]MBC8530737.1 PHP domain-containing protein [Gehongia tenuis]